MPPSPPGNALRRIAEKRALGGLRAHLLICTGGKCASRRTQRRALREARREVKARGLHRGASRVLCSAVGCLGVCKGGPIAVVWPDGAFYRKATPKNVRRIVREHAAEGRVVEALCIARVRPFAEPLPSRPSPAASDEPAER